MSKIYGWLKGNKGESTRCGHNMIWAKLQTWNGFVEVSVHADETAEIKVHNLNVRFNSSQMYTDKIAPRALNTEELIRKLGPSLRDLFMDTREGAAISKDRTWLHSLMPDKRVRGLKNLIKDLQRYDKELDFKCDTNHVCTEVGE